MTGRMEMIKAVLAAGQDIQRALPEDHELAFEALTFAIVECAELNGIDREFVHSHIDMVMNARAEAKKQMWS